MFSEITLCRFSMHRFSWFFFYIGHCIASNSTKGDYHCLFHYTRAFVCRYAFSEKRMFDYCPIIVAWKRFEWLEGNDYCLDTERTHPAGSCVLESASRKDSVSVGQPLYMCYCINFTIVWEKPYNATKCTGTNVS